MLEDTLNELENSASKKKSFNDVDSIKKKHAESFDNSFETIKDEVMNSQVIKSLDSLQETVKGNIKAIEALKESNQEVRSVKVIGIDSIRVEEVTIKNPITEVEIKNPVKEVEVKNMPSISFDGVKASLKSISSVLEGIPQSIAKAVKNIVQPVNVTNVVQVELLDPKTKRPYKAFGGGSVPVGGSSHARSSKADTTKVSVGSTSTAIVASNNARIQVVLVNDSDETIYLGYAEAAVLNEGIRLNANGGSIIEERFTGAINAISTSGGKNLTVVDIVL